MADNTDAINAKLDEVCDLMVEDGADRGTAEALVGFARPITIAVQGNFADLQRMGQKAVSGDSINDAFVAPPDQPTAAELAAQSGVSPANTRTDEEAAARTAEPAPEPAPAPAPEAASAT